MGWGGEEDGEIVRGSYSREPRGLALSVEEVVGMGKGGSYSCWTARPSTECGGFVL